MLLARATRCLYVLDTSSNKLMTRISKMPTGLFSETMTPFKEAGFAFHDKFVVGARHTFIGEKKNIDNKNTLYINTVYIHIHFH